MTAVIKDPLRGSYNGDSKVLVQVRVNMVYNPNNQTHFTGGDQLYLPKLFAEKNKHIFKIIEDVVVEPVEKEMQSPSSPVSNGSTKAITEVTPGQNRREELRKAREAQRKEKTEPKDSTKGKDA